MVDASREDNLGARFTEASLNFVNKVIQVFGGWENYFHHFWIVTGDAITFDDIGDGLDKRIEFTFLVRLELDHDKGFDVEI